MMLTANAPAARIAPSVADTLLMQTSSSRGSSDSDETALAVKPRGGSPGAWVVITVTPDANDPITRRNRSFSMAMPTTLLPSHHSGSPAACAVGRLTLVSGALLAAARV